MEDMKLKPSLLKDLKRYASKVFDYLCDHYGQSKYFNDLPCLCIENDEEDLMSGEFRDNCCELMINLAFLQDIGPQYHREAIATVLTHEYIHYLQSPAWMTRYYNMGYKYFDHPYEVEAYQRETELLQEILNL